MGLLLVTLIYTYTHIGLLAYMHAYVSLWHTYIKLPTYVCCVCLYVVHVSFYAYKHLPRYVCVCFCVYVCVRVRIYI